MPGGCEDQDPPIYQGRGADLYWERDTGLASGLLRAQWWTEPKRRFGLAMPSRAPLLSRDTAADPEKPDGSYYL